MGFTPKAQTYYSFNALLRPLRRKMMLALWNQTLYPQIMKGFMNTFIVGTKAY